MKLKWKLDPPATGRYASFSVRGWPSAIYNTEQELPAGVINSASGYKASRAKDGTHAPLHVAVAIWAKPRINGESAFEFKEIGVTPTLKEAKALMSAYITEHPEIWPPSLSIHESNEHPQKASARPKF